MDVCALLVRVCCSVWIILCGFFLIHFGVKCIRYVLVQYDIIRIFCVFDHSRSYTILNIFYMCEASLKEVELVNPATKI